MSNKTVIFIGRSGCGKGTQAKNLMDAWKKGDSKDVETVYVETGAKFRDFIKGKGYTNRLSKMVNDRTDRQPDFLAIWMWTHFFVENLEDGQNLVIDGAPRSLPEARVLKGALDFYKRRPVVVYIHVSRGWAERQLTGRGREDDSTHAKISRRLDWFDSDVEPAIDYFRNCEGVDFLEVNGERPISDVSKDILDFVQSKTE